MADPKQYAKLESFLKEQEGYSPDVYNDIRGNPTVGIGTNLKSPEVPKMLENMGISHDDVVRGDRQLTSEESQELMRQQVADKAKLFSALQQSSFPNAQIADNEKSALMSMYTNSPKLIGPNIQRYLDGNMKNEVVKEMMLRSNKHKDPGIESRRIREAELYAGPELFQNVVNTLSDDEKTQIREIVKGIKNPHERIRVMEQYPFLKEVLPGRYGRMLKD